MNKDMELFTIKNFREALNENFVLHAGEGQGLVLRLIKVEELSQSQGTANAARSGRAPFAAHFRGPGTPWARQHTYCLANERLGEMHIFLVPLGPDGEGMIYEAVFG